MRIAVAVLVMWASAGIAQTATEPALHHRVAGSDSGNGVAVQPGVPAGKQRGTSTLPASAQGEYMLDETGSVVQITIENGILDGYISKLTEQQTSALTYFFDRSTINGDRLTFTTKQIHGIWYSFDGKVSRGPGLNAAQDGFYMLDGALTTHDDVQKTTQNKTISLKLTAQH